MFVIQVAGLWLQRGIGQSFVSGFERLSHHQKMKKWGLKRTGFLFSILGHSLIEIFTSSYFKISSSK